MSSFVGMNTEKTPKQNKLQTLDLAYMAVGIVLITVCTWISIPFTIPFTMQTFAVFFVLVFLGGKRGTISILIYILLGTVGIPVFTGFMGGIGKLLGVTGGYILGFIFTGLLYWLAERCFGRKLLVRILSLLAGLLVCYAFGTAWFTVVYARDSGPIGLWTALTICVIPFVLPDLAKLALAVFVADRMKKLLQRT